MTRRYPVRSADGRRSYRAVKRVLDLVFVLLFLPVLVPTLALCALALKIECRRAPVLFLQIRTGENGRRFRMFKFRTMVPNAEQVKKDLAHLNKLRWPDFKVDDDPRITRVGRVLRKLSLDELPQIFNVLRAEMTLVGPRPTSFKPETYKDWQKARLDAVPGITGLWQVSGRGTMEFDDRVCLDIAYIERQCMSLDLRILLRTVGAVLRPTGV